MAPTGLKTFEIVLENKKRVKAVVAYDCTTFQYVILNYDLAVNVEGRSPMIDSLSWTYYRNMPTPEGEDSGRGGVHRATREMDSRQWPIDKLLLKPSELLNRCAECKADEVQLAPNDPRFKACGACHSVFYCSAKGYWGLHKSECGLADEGNFREIEMVRLRDAGRVYEDKGYRKKQGSGYFSPDGKIYMVVDGSGAE